MQYIVLILIIFIVLLAIQLLRMIVVFTLRPVLLKNNFLRSMVKFTGIVEFFLFARLSILDSPWDVEKPKLLKTFKRAFYIWIVLVIVFSFMVYHAGGFYKLMAN